MVNTENDLLIMADTFKDIVEKKNEEIKELKKVLMSVYGVIRLLISRIIKILIYIKALWKRY